MGRLQHPFAGGIQFLNGLARGRSYAESCLHGFDITYLLRSKLPDQVATRPKVDPSVRPKMPMKRTSMPPDPMSKAK